MIVVLGKVTVAPEHADRLRALARDLMATTRHEEGCNLYVFSQDLDDPATVHIAEEWTSAEALGAHVRAEHFAEWRAALTEMDVVERQAVTYTVGERRAL